MTFEDVKSGNLAFTKGVFTAIIIDREMGFNELYLGKVLRTRPPGGWAARTGRYRSVSRARR